MLHEHVTADPETDWKIRQCIADAGELVDSLNAQTATLAKARGDKQRLGHSMAQTYIDALMSDIGMIAVRVGLTAPGLIALVTSDRNRKARRGRPAPTRETSRTLLDRLTAATAAEAEALREVNAGNIRLAAAQADRKEAEERYAAYGAQPLVQEA